MMLAPVDGWTIAHGLAGLFLGRMRLNRWLFYPAPVIWEVFQIYFHFYPRGYYLGYFWANSLLDIFACVLCYELARRYSSPFESLFRAKISARMKAIGAYPLIVAAVTWAFWDDTLRLGLAARMPLPQLPLVIGAFSPVVAAFLVKVHILNASNYSFKPLSYYLFAGLLPSVILLVVIFLVKGI